jgi:Common central domain of tyrosinase
MGPAQARESSELHAVTYPLRRDEPRHRTDRAGCLHAGAGRSVLRHRPIDGRVWGIGASMAHEALRGDVEGTSFGFLRYTPRHARWDAIEDREIPPPLTGAALLSSWSITRHWDASQLASPADVALVVQLGSFTTFQRTLEGAVHAGVHNAVGGNMATASSPADPLFWLHHANLDRLWARWQSTHPGKNPSNTAEVLKPSPLFGVKVSAVLDIAVLGYAYA